MNNISCRPFRPNTKDEQVRPLSAVFLSLLASMYSGAADAQISDNLVRIGVLGDLSGVYADFGGPGNVVAARMAVEDFGGKVLGKPIDVIAADHQQDRYRRGNRTPMV
jgi:branched-chain amino acid transport system substrate-binding protein